MNAPIEPTDGARLVDLTPDEYHADPCPSPSLSSSVAKTLLDRSPAHAWAAHPKLGGEVRAPTAAMDRGTLIHRLVLGAGADLEIISAPDWRTKAAREAREAARDNGTLPVLEHVYEEACEAANAIRANLGAVGLELEGEAEVACIWQEETASGPIWCRGLFDLVNLSRGLIVDLKSSVSAHERACQRHVLDYGYDVQRAAYVRGLERARPELEGRVELVFAFVETEPPYAVNPVHLDGVLMAYGEARWSRACEAWGQCLSRNHWPGYAQGIGRLSAPGWLASKMEEW